MTANKVTKYDLVESIYESVYKNTGYESDTSKFNRKIVQDVVECLFEEIKRTLAEGKTIELRKFGTFEPRLRKGRAKARNPKTGEQISDVSDHYVAVFRSGQELKKSMRDLKSIPEDF